METKYVVVVDRQGGSFGMGRAYTINEWREQAAEWANADDDEGLEKAANTLKDSQIMDFIADIWDIEFGKLIVVNGKNYAWTAYPVNKKNGDKTEITIYPLDEDYETLIKNLSFKRSVEEQVVYSPLTVDEIDEEFVKDIVLKTLDKDICL